MLYHCTAKAQHLASLQILEVCQLLRRKRATLFFQCMNELHLEDWAAGWLFASMQTRVPRHRHVPLYIKANAMTFCCCLVSFAYEISGLAYRIWFFHVM